MLWLGSFLQKIELHRVERRRTTWHFATERYCASARNAYGNSLADLQTSIFSIDYITVTE